MARVPGSSTTIVTVGRIVRYVCATLLTVALGFAAAVVLGAMLRPDPVQPAAPATLIPQAAARDVSRHVLNALLAAALDADAAPLRWVDPRAALHCGPNTAVLVNREPLRAGALVPETPFEVDWLSGGCRPFGPDGPRLDGRVTMTVFREDRGWSAVVEPTGFRIAPERGEIALARSCGSLPPQSSTADDPALLAAGIANEELPCR